MFKLRDGFTLPEVLMTIGLMSFIALGVVPLLGKDLATLQRDDKLKDFHGIIECYYDVDGNLRQFVWDYSNKEHNKTGGVLTKPTGGKCEISLPDVNFYKIHLIGAGSRGYGIDKTETRNVAKALEYSETDDYYGRDLYGASGTTNKIKKSTYGGSNRGTYNIIKLSNDFYKKFDYLPDPVKNAWSRFEDSNGKGPLIKYEVHPAAGVEVSHSGRTEDCSNIIDNLLSLGLSKDGWREAPSWQLGNPYEITKFQFVVPPADSGDRQLKFNYNIYYGGTTSDTKPSSRSVIQITDTANKGANWKKNNFYVGIKYWWKNSPCNGSYNKDEACKVDDQKEKDIVGLFGDYTCVHDMSLSFVESLFPFDRPVVYTDSDGSFTTKILSNSVLQDLLTNTMGFDRYSFDTSGSEPNYNLRSKTYYNSINKHYLKFNGAQAISGKCGSNYSAGLPPCFRFDSKKVKLEIPVGKRGSNGADYQTVYEKVNAHKLILEPGVTDGAASKLYMQKTPTSEAKLLVQTIEKKKYTSQDPFYGRSASQSIVMSDEYEPLENVTSTKYSSNLKSDILDLMNKSIVDGSAPDYTFANAYKAAEKGSSYGMYAYFNSTATLRNNFAGPGRGGHGAHPYVGEVNVGVEARIHDSESLKTVDYSHEYVPSVIGECLVKNSQIDDYVDAGGADETRRRYCNAHPGYGGAVIVTW